MKRVSCRDKQFKRQLEKLYKGTSLFDSSIEARVRAIIDEVSSRGDAALIDFTEKFDGIRLKPNQLRVDSEDLQQSGAKISRDLKKAITEAESNIRLFSRRALRKAWSCRNKHGAKTGEKFDPFQRVGIYIPGGTAPLVSTVLMTVTLAKVAGCSEIVVCTPCNNQGNVNSAIVHALHKAGATEVYRIGGAQAIAAMALGTRSIKPVQKIFGPGNAYVVMAKRLLFGYVSVDLLPGPSEVMILADDTATPSFIAADILAQAEHGSGYERVCLVSTSSKIIDEVELEIKRQLPLLSRKELIQKALKNYGWLIHVESMEQGTEIVNRFAPEHCEIMTRNPRQVAKSIRTAGALFLGSWSPTVLGDYVAGPSHTLPTGGAGASFAGLTVDQFQRRTSVVEYSQGQLQKALDTVQAFASMGGLDAHGRSAAVRME